MTVKVKLVKVQVKLDNIFYFTNSTGEDIVKNFIILSLLAVILQMPIFAADVNLNKILDTANKSNKHLFVWFHKDGCGYCERMRKFTLDDEKVKHFIDKKFYFVHLNVSKNDRVSYKNFSGNTREFAKHMGFDFYPTSLFFSKDTLVHKVFGYRDEVEFYKILKYIQTKSYKQVDYNTFENNFDFNEKEF